MACGLCCKAYSVVLSFPEWLNITKNFGIDKTTSTLNKLLLKRRSDGSCIFLYKVSNMYLCGIQHMKPKACKLWPFKILSKPKFGHEDEAVYYYMGNKLYIYADPMCPGITYGRPTPEFANSVLREFVEIALGLRENQSKTTANVNLFRPNVYMNQRLRIIRF